MCWDGKSQSHSWKVRRESRVAGVGDNSGYRDNMVGSRTTDLSLNPRSGL